MSIQETKKWFEAAVPAPTEENFNVQLGCHLEEVVEMLDNLCTKQGDDILLARAADSLEDLSKALKNGSYKVSALRAVDHLDALADQIVTAVGCAHMAGMDIVGALNEVNRSNFSKFEDGKPVFNEHGKIAKGRNYKAPDLARFVGVGE